MHGDAVHFLVTADQRIHTKAADALIGDRVFTSDDCVAMHRGLSSLITAPPPAVEALLAHQLDETDPIFASFCSDYPGFDEWLRMCKREHRQAWAVRPRGEPLHAFTIVKREPAGEYGLPGPALKICSFKVSELGRGFRYGELMLKAVFEYAFRNHYPAAYVTIFGKYDELVALFREFGFLVLDARTPRGEVVLMKRLNFTPEEFRSTRPLEFNVRFGPPHVKLGDVPCFVVPILPKYHQRLFPDAEDQVEFFPGREGFGNSIAKAYLCNAPTRQIEPGSLLLSYRSQDRRSVQCIGVAEATLVSQDAAAIARFVGKRTVYRYHEIEQMCAQATLAIRFRHARVLSRPLGLAELVTNRVLTTAPQSITRVREEGRGWLRDQIEPWP